MEDVLALQPPLYPVLRTSEAVPAIR
jgi:hypothetical protein